MNWHNEPAAFREENGSIFITTRPKSDFWRITHYDFIRDDGQFYYQTVSGSFLAEVKVIGAYRDLYDQAGLMVRLDEHHWIKCGIELVEGVQQASVVVTRDYSDWSVIALPQNPPAIWLRLKREGDAVEVHYALDGQHYTMMRLAYFPVEAGVHVGLMCASPQGEGFEARFEDFRITPG